MSGGGVALGEAGFRPLRPFELTWLNGSHHTDCRRRHGTRCQRAVMGINDGRLLGTQLRHDELTVVRRQCRLQ